VSAIDGAPVIVSDLLPFRPSAGEDGRRIVRHGLRDVLRWLGEEVGPQPGEPTHAVWVEDSSGAPVLLASRDFARDLQRP
jgi:hypothetical protein